MLVHVHRRLGVWTCLNKFKQHPKQIKDSSRMVWYGQLSTCPILGDPSSCHEAQESLGDTHHRKTGNPFLNVLYVLWCFETGNSLCSSNHKEFKLCMFLSSSNIPVDCPWCSSWVGFVVQSLAQGALHSSFARRGCCQKPPRRTSSPFPGDPRVHFQFFGIGRRGKLAVTWRHPETWRNVRPWKPCTAI